MTWGGYAGEVTGLMVVTDMLDTQPAALTLATSGRASPVGSKELRHIAVHPFLPLVPPQPADHRQGEQPDGDGQQQIAELAEGLQNRVISRASSGLKYWAKIRSTVPSSRIWSISARQRA